MTLCRARVASYRAPIAQHGIDGLTVRLMRATTRQPLRVIRPCHRSSLALRVAITDAGNSRESERPGRERYSRLRIGATRFDVTLHSARVTGPAAPSIP